MTALREKLLKGDAVPVAAALLLPIPLFAQSGLSVPLPGVVERGLGSLVTLDAGNERSGTELKAEASENGQADRRSGRGSLRIVRSGGESTVLEDGTPAGTSSGPASDEPADDDGGSGNPPAGGEPEGGGGSTGAGSPGDPDSGDSGTPESSSGSASSAGSTDEPGLSVTATGQGTSTGVSADSSGVGVDVGADTGSAGGADAGSAEAEVTGEDGSRTGVGTEVPGAGVLAVP